MGCRLTIDIQSGVHDIVHDDFGFGLCQHRLMKMDLRISIKDYLQRIQDRFEIRFVGNRLLGFL
jgi:hypothetical protein